MIINAQIGFLGMFGSLDYMHYCQKNCRIVWQGQLTQKMNHKLIIFKAIVNQSILTWHVFFGLPCDNNDLFMFWIDCHQFSNCCKVCKHEFILKLMVACPFDTIICFTTIFSLTSQCVLVFVQTIHQPQGKKQQQQPRHGMIAYS